MGAEVLKFISKGTGYQRDTEQTRLSTLFYTTFVLSDQTITIADLAGFSKWTGSCVYHFSSLYGEGWIRIMTSPIVNKF